MLKQPTEPVLASNRSRIDLSRLLWPVFENPQRPIAQALMWPVLVVVRGVGLNDVVKLSEAETKESVQTLTL